ncbi:hypothetical protein DOY81_009766 [Sarcophaga bullata]|nr:hypothetical protein DOY81_009766 [Sarcophaga bullata]
MTKTRNIFTEADDVPLPSSDEEESSEESAIDDDDTCTPFELEQSFQQKYMIHDETAVISKKTYISLAKDDSFTRLAAGLSDGSVHIFDISSERGLSYSTPDCLTPPPSSKDPAKRTSILEFVLLTNRQTCYWLEQQMV